MTFPWFRRSGLFYLPVSGMGWIILLATLAYAVYTFIDIDRDSHSASDTLINFTFQFLLAGAVYSLIGFFTSLKSGA